MLIHFFVCFCFFALQEGTVVDFDSSSGAIAIELSKESLKKARGTVLLLCLCQEMSLLALIFFFVIEFGFHLSLLQPKLIFFW